ncbi:hypothetical protein [Ornithinimicrobium kibberense]
MGPGQDHRRRPRAAARPRLQRLSRWAGRTARTRRSTSRPSGWTAG